LFQSKVKRRNPVEPMAVNSTATAAASKTSSAANAARKQPMRKSIRTRAETQATERRRLEKRVAQQADIAAMLQSDSDTNNSDSDEENHRSEEITAKSGSKSRDVKSNDDDSEILDMFDNSGSKKKATSSKYGNNNRGGVIYIGRLPHGFYETEMKQYLSQFGTVTRMRIARNKRTGHSKHYAFAEFQDAGVAEIVAETMDGYLLFNHVLRCSVVPPERVHANLFLGTGLRFRMQEQYQNRRGKSTSKNSSLSEPEPKTQIQAKRCAKRTLINAKLRQKKLLALGIQHTEPLLLRKLATKSN
jgi:nucleolar protein 15